MGAAPLVADPLPADTVVDGQVKHIDALSQALLPWSKTLPRRHRIRLAFPAGRTLQKTFPRPAMRLGERERLSWVAGSLARELDMAGDDLRFDYREDTLQDAYRVTAAQHKDVAELLELAQSLRLHVAAITPDACALQRLIPLLAPLSTGCAGAIPASGYGPRGIAGEGTPRRVSIRRKRWRHK